MRKGIKSRDEELITMSRPKSVTAEAYRSLRTNLDFMSPDNPLRSILFTSSGTKEGKSKTISNLAISMAQAGKKTVLLDCDLRKPMLHRFFNLPNYEGLSSVLTDEITSEEALRGGEVENLQIITSGIIPPNPAELLGSKRMGNLLQKLSERFEMVLLDTPPVIAVADAVILGGKVDGVILVVASHQTHREMLSKAYETLKKGQVNIIGAILNKYPLPTRKGYYYDYYQY